MLFSFSFSRHSFLLWNLYLIPNLMDVFRYLCLFAMTLVIVLLWPANEVVISRKLGDVMASIRSLYSSFRNAVKEKNEDENCEYEEMWDAEGSMHLIKKSKKVSSTSSNESSSIERCDHP